MPLIPKPNYNQIFASQAPDIDKPAVFNNYPEGWGPESRPNNGKPTIKGFNYLQQTSDLKDLWILQNGACLPHDESIEYAEGAPVLKDGVIQYKTEDGFSPAISEKPYILNYFTEGVLYPLNARVMLDNGDIVKSTIGGNTTDPNADMTEWVFDWADAVVPSINDLPTHAYDGMTVYVKSYHAGLGLGGGIRTYDSQRKQEDDGFLCIRGWVLVKGEYLTPEQAGAKGDNIYDDYDAIQKVLSTGYPVEFTNGLNYRTSKPLRLSDKQKIRGNGARITKYTDSTTGLSLPNYNYDVDCAMYVAVPNDYPSFLDVRDLTVVKEAVGGVDSGYVMFMPYICKSILESLFVVGGEYGFYSENAWMMKYSRLDAYSKCGFKINRGTSNTFDTCWSKYVKDGYSGFDFNNLVYSTLENCCVENAGADGYPAISAYRIRNSDLTLSNCGIENSHLYSLVFVDHSRVVIENPSFAYDLVNKYRATTHPALIYIKNPESVLTIIGGRIHVPIVGATFADGVNVSAGTFTMYKTMWRNFVTPPSSGDTTLVHAQETYVHVDSYMGDSYTHGGLKSNSLYDMRTPFYSNGIGLHALTSGNISNSRSNMWVGYQNSFANGTTANGYPANSWAGIVLNMGALYDQGTTAQVAIHSYSNSIHYRRASHNGGFSGWMHLLTSGNTTVDGNGFVKAASPIVQLFADKIELNDEAQQQNIEFEKLGVGDYLVKGSSGFAQDGWYIETPKDANGNVLVAVVYEPLANGDISVKTYDYMLNNKGRILADTETPVDIPETRWIDLRLQELPIGTD